MVVTEGTAEVEEVVVEVVLIGKEGELDSEVVARLRTAKLPVMH